MQSFSPFPLRARGLVEQFDAAIKLYKQYFWVLLGWSAISTMASLLGAILPMGGMAALFLAPLNLGAAVCCVAAAVRGQGVEFGQCWRFTQPRYWPILGLHMLSWLIGGLILLLLFGVLTAIVVGGVFLFRDSTGPIQIFMAIFALLVLGTLAAIFSTVLLSWMGLVPIVVCMEENQRGTQALSRAYEILRGHWVRITSLMALVGFAILALYLILLGTMALLLGLNNIRDLANGRFLSDSTFIIFLIAFGGSATLLGMLYTPLYNLILTVFYLDVRVRQEALDLEWAAHVTAPAETPMVQETAPVATGEYLPQTAPAAFGTRPLDTVAPTPSVSAFDVSTLNTAPTNEFVDAQPIPETTTPAPVTPESAPSSTESPFTSAPTPAVDEPSRPQW